MNKNISSYILIFVFLLPACSGSQYVWRSDPPLQSYNAVNMYGEAIRLYRAIIIDIFLSPLYRLSYLMAMEHLQ
jgi:hypothetical protein